MAAPSTAAAPAAPPPPDFSKATDGTRVIAIDPWLEPFAPALRQRYALYKKWRDTIEQTEGGLAQFARGHERLGFHVDERSQAVVYREWAPGATSAALIGDFNGWSREAHAMRKNEFGVWEITIPAADGKCAIAHGSKLKISMTTPSGERIERLPAWIK
jgi:1,4-alpha-glucan branching enzyme